MPAGLLTGTALCVILWLCMNSISTFQVRQLLLPRGNRVRIPDDPVTVSGE